MWAIKQKRCLRQRLVISPVIEVMFKLKNTIYYLDKGLNVHKLHKRLLLGSKCGAVVRATASQ